MTKPPAPCTCSGLWGFGSMQGDCLQDLRGFLVPGDGPSGKGRWVTRQGEQLAAASLASELPRSARLSCLCPAKAGKSQQGEEQVSLWPLLCAAGGGSAHNSFSLPSLGTGNTPREGLVCTALGSCRDPRQGLA